MTPRATAAAISAAVSAGASGLAVLPAAPPIYAAAAALAALIIAGLLVWLLTRVLARPGENTSLRDAIRANSQLRHDMRGALSPALLVSDRLTGHADPAVAKAGNTVVRAVERATELLESNKTADAGRF